MQRMTARGDRAGRGRPAAPKGVALALPVGKSPPGPLYTQVYRQVRAHILSGALKPGSRLPSARTLAADLQVSRNTVEAAFLQLVSEGFVERRVGSGSVVARAMAEGAPFAPAARGGRAAAPAQAPAAALALSRRGRLMSDLGQAEIAADQPAGLCATDVAGFPAETWNRLLFRHARRGETSVYRPADPCGLPALREALAEHIRLTRGVQCQARQVLVVSSTQQAIDLAARLLLDPGATALVEEPGYPGARAALLAAGATVRGVPVDGEGLVAERLPARPGARLLYITPSHQFPLGVTLSLARRLALLHWAARTGAWILEDDYDSEFRYDGRPLAALQGLDREGRVLYLGTCNKVLFPGLRLAYLVVPEGLVDAFAAGRRISDGFSPPLPQAVLADFLAGGYFAGYLRQARVHYAACRDALVRRVTRAWDGVPLGPSDTGLHLVAYLPRGSNDTRLARGLPDAGFGVSPLSRYYYGEARRRGLLLFYGATTPERIARGVGLLTPQVAPLLRGAGRPVAP